MNLDKTSVTEYIFDGGVKVLYFQLGDPILVWQVEDKVLQPGQFNFQNAITLPCIRLHPTGQWYW